MTVLCLAALAIGRNILKTDCGPDSCGPDFQDLQNHKVIPNIIILS